MHDLPSPLEVGGDVGHYFSFSCALGDTKMPFTAYALACF